MESNIINIATLTIDKKEATESIVQTKQRIFELQKANSALRKDILDTGDATGEQTKKFVQNEAELKQLTASYRAQQTAVNELTLSEVKETKALTENVNSIMAAKAQNKELLNIRNQVDTSTKEGEKAIELLNAKINENTKYIVENGTEQEKASHITGNYRQKIFELGSSLADTVPGFQQARTIVSGFSQAFDESADKVTNFASGLATSAKAQIGFGNSTKVATVTTEAQTVATKEATATQIGFKTGVKASTTATEAQAVAQEAVTVATNTSTKSFKLLKLAIIGTGIGAIVILIVSLATALSQSETAGNKLGRVFAGLKGIVNALSSVLRPFGEFLIEKIGGAFDYVGDIAEKSLKLVAKGLKAIGLDNASKSVDKFTESVKGNIKATQQLADAEAKYAVAQRQSEKIQLDYQYRAEKIRNLRDDETKSIPERMKLNNQLIVVLRKQASEELAIANQAENIAKLRIKLTGKSTENLNQLAEAETKISDIRERISGQESEQLANLNSLRNEAKAKEKETTAAEKASQLKALEDKKLVFETEVHTADEKLKFYTKHYESLNKIQGGSEAVKNAQEQSKIILEIATSTIDAEIELQKTAISEKKKISEEEKNELIKNAEFLKEAENGRIEQSLLTKKDKAAAKLEIEKGYNESLAIINQTFKDSEIARKEEEAVLNALEHENKLLLLEEQGYSERDLKLAILQEQYTEEKRLLREKLANDKISQDAYNATKAINEKKFTQASKKIDDETTKQKKANQMNLVKSALSAAQAIFSESKELAIASALLNTYEGISAGVALGFPMAIPAVAMAAATGFKAVQSILSTNPGSGAGGDTASPTATATAQFENPARTTSIATTNQTPSSVTNASGQPILILESLKEAQTNQQVKIKST